MEHRDASSEYIKGFNEGYMIAKNMPDLASQLQSITGNSERSVGFQDGRKQYELEKFKERDRKAPSGYQTPPLTKDKDHDRD